MTERSGHAVVGPLRRRIVELVASPNGRWLACMHLPKNHSTDDYHWLFFRQAGDAYVELGTLPYRPKAYRNLGDTLKREEVVALDDGGFVVLESAGTSLYVTRYEASDAGLDERSCWCVGPADAGMKRALRVMPSGREALLFYTSVYEEHSDWTGGPPSTYYQHWRVIDLATGAAREEATWSKVGEEPIAPVTRSRGISVIAAFSALPWLAARPQGELALRQRRIEALSAAAPGDPIRFGARCFLTSQRVIEIASGDTLLAAFQDPKADRFGTPPRLHDLSPDESYVAGTGEGGCFELWNIALKQAWRPELPAHGGVHTMIFLPGGKAALGTAEGGVIIVDCRAGVRDEDWHAF